MTFNHKDKSLFQSSLIRANAFFLAEKYLCQSKYLCQKRKQPKAKDTKHKNAITR